MSSIDALRIRHEHDIPLTTKNIDIDQGLTIEAWVKVAPTDPVVRIYPEIGYQGNPVKLKAGAYPSIKATHFSGLGSVDLPEGIEAVFFAEKDYKGKPFVMREDQSEIDPPHNQAGSVIIMDRRHGRQSHVVLFEKENYEGEAQLLLVAEEWTIRQNSKSNQKKLLSSVKSAWVPPGVALDLFSRRNTQADWFDDATDYGTFKFINMDNDFGVLKDTTVWFNNFAYLDYDEFNGYGDILEFGGANSKFVVFEKENFEGAFQILNSNGDWIKLLELPWFPKSAFRYSTNKFQSTPGEFEGIFVFQKNIEGYHNVYLYQPGLKMLNPHTDDKIWIPPQYRLIPPETTSREPLDPQNPEVKSIIVDKKSKDILKPGLYGNINLENYLVERLDKKSLEGDLSKFPEAPVKIIARRIKPLEGTEMLYTDENGQEGKTKAITWAGNVPAFRMVRLPNDYALYLFEKANYEGRCTIVVGGRDDFRDLAFVPRSAAYAEASKGINGVLSTEKREEATAHIYANGEKLPTNFKGKVSIANGYRLYPDPYDKSDPIYGAGYHTNVNLDGYTVERFAGILTTGGFGLLVERKKGKLRGEGEEIRFGERAIRPDRWYHLALTYDGKKVKYLLDGIVIQEEERKNISLGTNWILGEKFRGSIGQLRVWDRVLEPAQIRDFRFPGKTLTSVFPEGAQLPTSLLNDELSDHTFPPDAVMVTSEVYKDPLNTTFTKHKLNEVKAEQKMILLEAKNSAAKITGHARKRQQYKIALAHERQRRKIHINGIAQMVFVRGDVILVGSPKGNEPAFAKQTTGDIGLNDRKESGHRVNDSILGENGEIYLITDGIKKRIEVHDKSDELLLHGLFETGKLAGEAIACDFSHNHELAANPGDNYPRTGLYWIESDGSIYNIWVYKPTDQQHIFKVTQLFEEGARILTGRKLTNMPTPLGRPKNWDITIGEVSLHETRIYWTNGWEIYRGVDTVYATENASGYEVKNPHFVYELLVPHVASPHPIAIEMAPDGTLIWLDKEAEMIKVLTKSQLETFNSSKFYKEPKDLYKAVNPSAGLAVCELADVKNSGENVTYIYWVSAERRVLEVPVIDTPGQYIDFWYDEKFPYKFGQHVDEVPIIDSIGAEFVDASKVIPFKSDRGTIYGPFDVNEGFSIKIKLYVKDYTDVLNKSDLLLSFLLEPVWFLTRSAFRKIDSEPFDTINMPLPTGKWFDLELRIDKDEDGDSQLRIYEDGRLRNDFPGKGYKGKYDIMEGQQHVHFKFPADPLAGIVTEGYFSELTVTSLKDNSILAKRDLNTPKSEKVRPLKALIDPIVIDGVAPNALPTKVLSMTDVNDVVLFDPVRLDFKNGFTVSVDLMMSKDSKNDTPICVYELSTFEDETRLVCGFDTDGLPRLFLRWKGDRIRFLKKSSGTGHVKKNERKRVTWAMTAEGYVTTYIEGMPYPKIQEHLDWKSEPCVFENHRLGSPNDIQTHIQVENALAYNRVDRLLKFEGFTGKIFSFSAWNTYLPQAAEGQKNLPGPDLSWDRSLVTVESLLRYLHAGRLDGQEPPVSLFPIDLDSGLSIQSILDQSHAKLTAAHAALAAAKEYAAHLKEVELAKARAKLQEETERLVKAQLQAKTEKEKAEATAKAKNADARRLKSNASQKAKEERVLNARSVKEIKDAGQAKADAKVRKATEEKDRKVAVANSRLSGKKNELEKKKGEYEKKK